MPSNCGAGEDSWESLGEQRDKMSPSWRESVLNIHWKDWCWSWSSNTLPIWCKEPTHWKRPWCWERLKARGEGDDRGWDGWMASPTQWTWVWANSRRWWRTGKPGVLQSMGSQRVGCGLATERKQYPTYCIIYTWELFIVFLEFPFPWVSHIYLATLFGNWGERPWEGKKWKCKWGRSVVSDSLWPHGL